VRKRVKNEALLPIFDAGFAPSDMLILRLRLLGRHLRNLKALSRKNFKRPREVNLIHSLEDEAAHRTASNLD
jgi:hypothetical protein